jgi:hypothetical protein
MQRKDGYNIVIHILFGLIFLSFSIFGSPDFPDLSRILGNPMGRSEIFSQLLLLIYFYVNFFYIIPRFFFRKRYVQFGFITLGIILLLIAIVPLYFDLFVQQLGMPHRRPPMGMDQAGHPHPHPHPPRHRLIHMLIQRNLYMFFFVFSVGLLIKMTQKWRESEKEKMNTELSYLKAQINPHFLFNTLNSIYSLSIVENANNTAEAIIKLSSMMRYVTQEALGDKVSLEKELEYIDSYIELQKIRFGETVKLNVSIDRAHQFQYIVPLILISFIENAFKYGVNPEENSEITIKIEITGDRLKLFVKNNKVHTVDDGGLGSGIGIQNTINRLNLVYDGQYELMIDDNEKTYSLNFELLLT